APSAADDDLETTALDACTQLAIAGGRFKRLDPSGVRASSDGAPLDTRPNDAANADGFDVHAAVRIRDDDDLGREKLVRYCARPPFALDRIERLPDGNIAYRVKYARRGATHRVMTPIEFLARLAALIPPPKYPLVRYHGVLAPHAKWRSSIVPKRPDDPRLIHHSHRPRAPLPSVTLAAASPAPLAAALAAPTPIASRDGGPGTHAIQAPAFADAAIAFQAALVAPPPNVLRAAHLRRLHGGALLAAAPRLDWATLMHRTFDADVLRCPKCEGRMRVVADLEDPSVKVYRAKAP
ncbi:MAG: transposase, partial [Polyangiales bacterium]